MANTAEPLNPDPPIPEFNSSIDVPPLDMDFLNNDLGFMDDLDFDFDISFDDLTFPNDGSDVVLAPSSIAHDSPNYCEGVSDSPYLDPRKVDRSFNDVSRVLNSPSPEYQSPETSDPKTTGSGNSQESGGCSSVGGGFINSPSPESGVMSGSTSPASDCNVQSVVVDVVDQEVKVEEEAKGAKRKKEEENLNKADSNPRKFRKSTSTSMAGSPLDGVAPVEDKKKARLMRNRESAQLSRQRKKHYVEELEDKVRSMHTVIADLNNRISYIIAENASLRQQLSGGNVPPPPQPGVYPPPGMAPMPYPWIPCGAYPMNPQGSQVPLVPIPRLKPRQPTSTSKPKKSEVKKTESKTKKVSSVTFLGLLFFLFLFGGLVPLVNVRYGGKMENGYTGFGFNNGVFHGHPKERILTVNNHLNMSHPSGEEGYHSVASDLRECGANRINCRRVWVEGTESNVKQGKQGSQHIPSSNGSLGNSSESLAASLYVPRNDKLVKIDGNLIIHSVLASERAMASRAASEMKRDKASGSPTNESPQTSLAIAGNLAAAFSVPNDERHADRHSHVYRSPSARPKALNAGSRDNYKETPRSTATDGSLQKWFLDYYYSFLPSMAAVCFFIPTPSSLNNRINGDQVITTFRTTERVRRTTTCALSTHSNPRILKSNKKSRYGETLSPYDSDEDDSQDDDDDEDDSEDEDDEELFSDDEFPEMADFSKDLKNSYSKKTNISKGHISTKKDYNRRLNGERVITTNTQLEVKDGNIPINKRSFGDIYYSTSKLHKKVSMDNGGRGKLKIGASTESRYLQLSEELELDEKWYPLLDYLSTFGLKESHFVQIYERHMASLQINVASAQERLEFLLSVGVKHRDIRKIILRQPQILEYTVENNMKSHVAFLVDLGIPHSRLGHIISSAPSLFSYSVEQSLKPTVRYLVEEVGIKRNDVSKVVQLSPQILVQRLDNSWTARYDFLSKELGASKDSIVKMVRKHPQLLHYSIEDGILPRINFLRSIGMRNSEVLKVLTSLTQVLSLSLEDNLKPKHLYLVNELKNEVQTLTKYPTYLSLSLDQRIRPRHRFLVSLKKAPKGPFPLSYFVPTDENFCQQWAKTSLDAYLAFRQNLLLKQFAKKYERR